MGGQVAGALVALGVCQSITKVPLGSPVNYRNSESSNDMAHPSQLKTVTNLRHITGPRVALLIATSEEFRSFHSASSYDGGANFLGVRGETSNTQPLLRGATLICSWTGQVSVPVRYDAYDVHTPNVLFDFNGSGAHFPNNDPRYFLPYGSKGLVLNAIHFDNDKALLEGWCYLRGGPYAWAYKHKRFHKLLRTLACREVGKLNAACKAGSICLTVG